MVGSLEGLENNVLLPYDERPGGFST